MIPIPRTIEDPSYRYKMSILETKVEGKGNGRRTNLMNLAKIAKDLQVPSAYLFKFFEIDLGTKAITQKQSNKEVRDWEYFDLTVRYFWLVERFNCRF